MYSVEVVGCSPYTAMRRLCPMRPARTSISSLSSSIVRTRRFCAAFPSRKPQYLHPFTHRLDMYSGANITMRLSYTFFLMRSAAARISSKSAGSVTDMRTAVSSGRRVSHVDSLLAIISRTRTGSAGFSAISVMQRFISASSMKCLPPGRYLSISSCTTKFLR